MTQKTFLILLLAILLFCVVLLFLLPYLTSKTPSAVIVMPGETEQLSSATEPTTFQTVLQTDVALKTATPTTTLPVQAAYTIVIDPGHQSVGDYGQEPIGPGALETKARVSSGTQGTTTGVPEYSLNLIVSLLLQQELTERGYTVIMTRETNDVSLSNAERAEIANQCNADAFIRIHANGSENSADTGILTICMTPNNPYNAALYEKSRLLSDAVLNCMADATGANKRAVWETDTMSGINYSLVPVTIIEMGFLTNPSEESQLVSASYQEKIVIGIADGLDYFFEVSK